MQANAVQGIPNVRIIAFEAAFSSGTALPAIRVLEPTNGSSETLRLLEVRCHTTRANFFLQVVCLTYRRHVNKAEK